jgi:hypothetical protein
LNQQDIIWLFGTARVGSTWLADMLQSAGLKVWREPLVGKLFGDQINDNESSRQRFNRPTFILSGPWRKPVSKFILENARQRFPKAERLLIKEPNGSHGAPLLSQAMPQSTLIALVRDPRDVVASTIGARTKGGWRQRSLGAKDAKLDRLVKGRSGTYARDIGAVLQAYDNHEGPNALLRYEDLRSDTLGEMKRLCEMLGIEADLPAVVEKHSWSNIPDEKKGADKFYRKATPGGWQEDLTLEQARTVEEITSDLLERLYGSS